MRSNPRSELRLAIIGQLSRPIDDIEAWADHMITWLEARGWRPPGKPALTVACPTCGRTHDPDRPDQHPRPAEAPPDTYLAARAAIRHSAQEAE